MNEPSKLDQTNQRFAEAVRDYAPTVSRKRQKLVPLKLGIAELRRKGASYQTITDILRAADVPVSRTTVVRFCQDVLQPAHRRKQRRPSSGSSPPEPHRSSMPPMNTDGPRIADPRTI